jgi:hypothetical protein
MKHGNGKMSRFPVPKRETGWKRDRNDRNRVPSDGSVETSLKRADPSVETCFIINWETWARKRDEGGRRRGEKEETRHDDCFVRLKMGA